MARYDIDITGVNAFQYRQGLAYQQSLDQEYIIATLLAIKEEGKFKSLPKSEQVAFIKTEVRNRLGGLITDFDIDAYIQDWSSVSDRHITKIILAYLLLSGLKRDEANEAIKIARTAASITTAFYTINEADAIRAALLNKTKVKISNQVAYYIKNGTDKQIIKAAKTKLIYNRALFDQFSESMSSLYGNMYGSYESLGLWRRHTWIAFNPKDEACSIADGETVELGQPFSNGLYRPAAHPNCWCQLNPTK